MIRVRHEHNLVRLFISNIDPSLVDWEFVANNATTERHTIAIFDALNAIAPGCVAGRVGEESAKQGPLKTASGYDVEWNLGELYRQVTNMGKRVSALESYNGKYSNFTGEVWERLNKLESAAKPATVDLPASFPGAYSNTDPIQPSAIFYETPAPQGTGRVCSVCQRAVMTNDSTYIDASDTITHLQCLNKPKTAAQIAVEIVELEWDLNPAYIGCKAQEKRQELRDAYRAAQAKESEK
jgi:hypothetical protein